MTAPTPAPEIALLNMSPDHWAIVRDILHRIAPGQEVWAYGSRARGGAKTYSDLDLAIITQGPLPLDLACDLAEAFSNSDLPWKVDITDWATTTEAFRAIIAAEKVVVQKP